MIKIKTLIISIVKKPIFLSLIIITFYYFIAYFPLIPRLGFYSEDVFVDYLRHFFGPDGVLGYLSADRPAQGYLLNFLYILLGENVLNWHISTFSIRLFGGYFLFFSLNKLWPKEFVIITLITLIFLLYPGFLQQPLPIGYAPGITTLTLWILSLLFTIFSAYAIKNNQTFKYILFTLLAVFLEACSLLLLEFFIGMEILRLILLIFVLNSDKNIFTYSISKFMRKIFVFWKNLMPYLATMLIFLFWRIFIFKGTRDITDVGYVMHTFYSNPIWIAKIPLEIIHSFLQTVIFAYFVPLIINFIRIPVEDSLISMILGVSSGLLVYLYLKKMDKHTTQLNTQTKIKKIGKQLLLIGLISIFFGLIPIVMTGRMARVYLTYDRYTLGNMIEVSFIIIGFLLFKFKRKTYQLIFIFILSLSITSQLMNGYLRVQNWEKQKDIWWQLYWRSPQIKDNAMLIFYFPELTKQSLLNDAINKIQWYRIYWVVYQISGLGNLFFNYNSSPNIHFNGDYLSDKGILQKIQNKTYETVNDSNLVYQRHFSNAVIITTPGDSSCLWVLNNKNEELPEFSNELLKSSIPYSDVTKLVKENAISIPPRSIFGKEPNKNWCYYFEKASLARQLHNWNELSQLTQEVMQKRLKPNDENEWLPFLEGLLVSQKYNDARNLLNWISQNYASSVIFNSNLCHMSKRLKIDTLESNCNL